MNDMTPSVSKDRLHRMRHSASHVLAEAVLSLFPDARLGYGPATEEGFFYDFDLSRTLTPEDLETIERRMQELLGASHPFRLREVTPDEARTLFAGQPYKLEIINEILARGTNEYGEPLPQGQQPRLTVYSHGNFTDLCCGPHVAATGEIPADAFKLLHVSAAYWRGNNQNPALQRIAGALWADAGQLAQYLHRLEEAKKRDHRILGRQLELFTTVEQVGAGLILWQPKGAKIRYLAERFSLEAHRLNGYEFVYTPHIGKATLWETSGHLDFYRENMYRPMDIDGEEYYLKPMNCPFHSHIYKSRIRSYKELPVRLAEFGTVYRYEFSGTLQGLTRVRGFTQDDAHIFCTPDQVEEEIVRALSFSLYILRTFDLKDFTAYISTRPKDKSIGAEADWEKATQALEHAVKTLGLNYEYDLGGGAFYGPKIDLKVTDVIGREWQLSTVQFDFNLPVRFDLEYIAADGTRRRPFMVHRALFGSVERFLGMLIEHFAGAFPFWLAPVQVVIVPITDAVLAYAEQVKQRLIEAGLRVEVDARGERMQAKIRDAQALKVPYVAVVGHREVERGEISLRERSAGNLGAISLDSFIDRALQENSVGTPRAIFANPAS